MDETAMPKTTTDVKPPQADSKPKAKTKGKAEAQPQAETPQAELQDLKAARDRMESAILDRRKALAHCPACGAQGNWETQSTKKPVRYLLCRNCRVGVHQIAVTDDEVRQALGEPAPSLVGENAAEKTSAKAGAS